MKGVFFFTCWQFTQKFAPIADVVRSELHDSHLGMARSDSLHDLATQSTISHINSIGKPHLTGRRRFLVVAVRLHGKGQSSVVAFSLSFWEQWPWFRSVLRDWRFFTF